MGLKAEQNDDNEDFATPESRGDFLEKPEEKEPEKDDDKPTDKEVEDATGKSDADKADKADDDKADDGDKAEVKEDKSRGIKVPKFRLDAALSRARDAETQLEEMRNTTPAQPATPAAQETPPSKTAAETLDDAQAAIDEKIESAMADGDPKLVNQLRAESRTLEREYNSDLMEQSRNDTQTETQAQVSANAQLDNVLDQLEATFPIFDENHESFDADANAYVLRLQQNFMAGENMSAADALVEAVNVAIPALGIDTESKDPVDTPDKPAAKSDKQVGKNIDASNRTPPDTSDVGEDGDTRGMKDNDPNAMDLTEEEFDALPAETMKRMRGDFA